jgi:hypothetical protein
MQKRFDFESHLFILDDLYRSFFINMLISHRVIVRSFNRDDLFIFIDFRDRREINEFENEKRDSDEIRSRWQRDSKMTWSEETISWETKISILRKISMNHKIKDQ